MDVGVEVSKAWAMWKDRQRVVEWMPWITSIEVGWEVAATAQRGLPRMVHTVWLARKQFTATCVTGNRSITISRNPCLRRFCSSSRFVLPFGFVLPSAEIKGGMTMPRYTRGVEGFPSPMSRAIYPLYSLANHLFDDVVTEIIFIGCMSSRHTACLEGAVTPTRLPVHQQGSIDGSV